MIVIDSSLSPLVMVMVVINSSCLSSLKSQCYVTQ